jgi:hypothetical protein
MLCRRERESEDETAVREAEEETVQRLADVRRAVAGEIESCEGVEAIRAALTTLFESFTLRRLWTDDAPAIAYLDLCIDYAYVLVPKCGNRRSPST